MGSRSDECSYDVDRPTTQVVCALTSSKEFSGEDPALVVRGPFERRRDIGAILSEPQADIQRTDHLQALSHGKRVKVPR